MAAAALDLNDAALTLAMEGRVLVVEPGMAAASGALGAEACAAPSLVWSRHWRDLDDTPLPRPVGPWRSAADIVQAQLEQLCRVLPADCGTLVAATPSYWTLRQLGLLLGIARNLGLPLGGLVDSAVAAARRPCPGRDLWHLELTLHDVGLTRIAQDGGAVRDTAQRLDWLSAQTLDRVCAQAIGGALLGACRFDPFHDADSERQLFGSLAAWLAALRGHEARAFVIAFRGTEFRAEVTAAEVRAAVAQAAERLVQRLRALAPARGSAVLQVPDRLADYPGLVESLARMPNWEIVVQEPGATALGALRLRPSAGTDVLALVTRLPWDRPAMQVAGPAVATAGAAVPTHICFAERVFRLDAEPFRIGSDLGDGEYGLRLPASRQGVSRRHCSVSVEDGRVMVHDHSRYGTRLNGVTVDGSAVLHAGDSIQIGQPPVELRLVVEEGRGGAPA